MTEKSSLRQTPKAGQEIIIKHVGKTKPRRMRSHKRKSEEERWRTVHHMKTDDATASLPPLCQSTELAPGQLTNFIPAASLSPALHFPGVTYRLLDHRQLLNDAVRLFSTY